MPLSLTYDSASQHHIHLSKICRQVRHLVGQLFLQQPRRRSQLSTWALSYWVFAGSRGSQHTQACNLTPGILVMLEVAESQDVILLQDELLLAE